MPRETKTPQDKKRLSRLKDRRNTYGENAKSSRKNIALNKTHALRKARHWANAALAKLDQLPELKADEIESTLKTPRLQKGRWRKCPDTPLGAVIDGKLKRRKADVGAKQRRRLKQTEV
jgi:hypothetical protein